MGRRPPISARVAKSRPRQRCPPSTRPGPSGHCPKLPRSLFERSAAARAPPPLLLRASTSPTPPAAVRYRGRRRATIFRSAQRLASADECRPTGRPTSTLELHLRRAASALAKPSSDAAGFSDELQSPSSRRQQSAPALLQSNRHHHEVAADAPSLSGTRATAIDHRMPLPSPPSSAIHTLASSLEVFATDTINKFCGHDYLHPLLPLETPKQEQTVKVVPNNQLHTL
jgi:hypothetical protein